MKLLIMIDMQNDFIGGVLGNSSTQAVLSKVCHKLKNALSEGWELMYTMDTHGSDYMSTMEGRKLPVPHCIRGTEGWELPAAIGEIVRDIPENRMVVKETFGAKDMPRRILEIFGEIPEKIELIGVCTDICVISNAMLLKANFPEADIIVDGNCCAGTSPESHERALEAMKMCHIDII